MLVCIIRLMNTIYGKKDKVRLASAGIHFGEEPVLTGKGGSGTLFFTGCTMKCPFCQNWQISHKGLGTNIDEDIFNSLCMVLAQKGAVNINLVTPGHFAPTIAAWVSNLKGKGFDLPFLWNSSGFDSVDVLKTVIDDIDIFLPDLKTLSPDVSQRYFKTSHYPVVAKESLIYLAERKPLVYAPSGLLSRGVIIRHLVIPGEIENSKEVLQWYAKNLRGKTLISIMTQYTPVRIPGISSTIPERSLSESEYESILSLVRSAGIENGFIQEWEKDQSRDWLPDFSEENPFPSDKSIPVWSWKNGFIKENLAF